MAYKINRDDEYIVHPDGPASMKDVGRVYNKIMQATPEFYELEPAEIIEIYLDEEDLPLVKGTEEPDWSKYGWALARMSISSKHDVDYVEIRPLETNIKEYPLPGEVVIVVEYFGDKYYTQKLNLHNSVNLNFHPGLSNISPDKQKFKIVDFKADPKIRQLQAEEGDLLFNGRFGQSIRFGSNITEIVNADDSIEPDTGRENSPNIIIRAGQGEEPTIDYKPVKEDINKDGSSMWMTSNQNVPLVPAVVGRYDLYRPKKFEGNQVILNSDRIVFNARGEDLNIYAKRSVNIISEKRIVLEGHGDGDDTFGVFLGGTDTKSEARLQPVIAGDQMMLLFEKLISHLIHFSGKLSVAKSSFAGMLVYLGEVNDPANKLFGELQELITRMEEPKSRVAKVLLDQSIGKIISKD
jgi:hypothetical protein